MRRAKRIAVVLGSVVVLLVLGGAAGWFGARETRDAETVTDTTTVTRTATVAALETGLPAAVATYDAASIDELTAHGRELLAPLGPLESVFVEGAGYLGWRRGIRPDGTWVFFVAGD